MTAAAAVSLSAATIALRGRTVLRDVDLEVEQGEFVAVLGPNGAGKSTLMRALLGLIPLASGSATVLGSAPKDARERIGYLPQRHGVESRLRIRGVDLVRLGLDGDRWGVPLALSPGARRRRRAERGAVEHVIGLVGAGGYADRPLETLSGGERQRLLIAQALVRRPSLLILDEPLDGLDLPNQSAVSALLSRISKRENVTVLLVAHDVNPLLGYVERVAYLAAGRALSGPTHEVITAEKLSALYGSPIEVLRTRDGRLVVVGQPEAPYHHGHRHDDALRSSP